MNDKLSVLIVDDEKDARETIAEVLEKEFNVDSASGGEEALKKLKGNRFHVVLLDIRMPGIDGIETLKRIKKEITASTPEIIMLTAFDEAKLAWEASKLGASDFITKPFKNEDLVLRAKMAGERKRRDDVFRDKVIIANKISIEGSAKDSDTKLAKRRYLLEAWFSKNGSTLDNIEQKDLEAIYSGKWDDKDPESLAK